MTATSAADYPTLGFDPTPGDQTQAAEVARTVRSGTDVLAEIGSVLHGAADGRWRAA